MAANIIATRIADFLKRYPPFTEMKEDTILSLSQQAIVQYFEPGDFVFKQDDATTPYLYIVREGVVHLERQEENTTVLVDVCDEGDLFGVRAMLSGKPFVFHAHCKEEALVYGIPIIPFKEILEHNSHVALFFANGLAGGQTAVLKDDAARDSSISDSGSLLNWNAPLKISEKRLVTAHETDEIRHIAQTMRREKVGSILLKNADAQITGIITDTDLRNKVATGDYTVTDEAQRIMSTGLVKMSAGQPLSTYLLKMLQQKIRHLAITEGGDVVSIISERDLVSAHQNHPVSLIYSIEEAENIEQLITYRNKADDLIQFYLQQDVAVTLTSSLCTHINDALITRSIILAKSAIEAEKGPVPTSFCWLSLGSEGRAEQVIRTDQDNAIIFKDVPEADLEKVQSYFLALAQKVNSYLNQAGFEFCPADMMAGNKQWCQPLFQWEHYFDGWIKTPEEKALMLSSIFFDFRPVFGDFQLAKTLHEHIRNQIEDERIFLNFLARNALKNPAPLGFFRNFMVERSGEHKDEFDIKARAMMPLIDSARVLCLDAGFLEESNTINRFRFLASHDEKRKELYHLAADSYGFLLKIRASKGFQQQNSGRYIPIESLSKLDRQILRNAFDPINQLQKSLGLRYQLSYFQ
jgi:CBS domain-containing protein